MNRKIPSIVMLAVGLTPCLAGSSYAQEDKDQALWTQLDRNESGWLSGNELNGGWVKYDTDADGEVTKAEFMAGRAAEASAPQPQAKPGNGATTEAARVKDAALFKKLDTSGEGYLDGGELKDGTFQRYDANGDGRVVLAEFAAGRAKERLAGAMPGSTKPTPVRPNPATAPNPATVPPKSGPVVRKKPSAAAPAKAAATAGGGPRAGRYIVMGYGNIYNPIRIGYFILSGGSQYRFYNMGDTLIGKGRYRFNAASTSVEWQSGPFKTSGWDGKFEISREGKTHTIRVNRATIGTNSTDSR